MPAGWRVSIEVEMMDLMMALLKDLRWAVVKDSLMVERKGSRVVAKLVARMVALKAEIGVFELVVQRVAALVVWKDGVEVEKMVLKMVG